jgi:hypothetical protein
MTFNGGLQTVNQSTIQCINDMVFMERMNIFEKPDVILYHPGHFPELNEQLLAFYKKSGADLIMIPEVFNNFLNCSEYEFYAPLLIEEGIEKDKLMPIQMNQDTKGVEGVIRSAFHFLNKTGHKNILLAGKFFFCRRFYFLASFYASAHKVIDVLPLYDNRDISPDGWTESERGRARVLNEIDQYAKIVKEKC